MMTQSELKALVSYDPITGAFTRLVQTSPRAKAGQTAGWLDGRGYTCFHIGGREEKAHRLAWLYVYGYWPTKEIDHINRIKTDNRIANLRHVSRQENECNKGVQKNNRSGFKGVSWHKQRGMYEAYCCIGGKKTGLGFFDDPAQGHAAYLQARAAHGINPGSATGEDGHE